LKPFNEDLDKKKKIIEKYNSTSNFYDDRYRKIQNEKYKLQFEKTKFKHKTLLDAGCGTGLLFEYISNMNFNNLNKNLKYIGLDISLRMLTQFTNKIKRLNHRGNSSLILGDIENLPFRDDKFNLILSITSLQNLQDLRKGLQELIRVGKKNTAFTLSILLKQLKLEEVITYLNSHMINLKTEIVDDIEDVIIQGTLLKD
jgi:demethylmenaquinone methyltransferase/2-methoxy-6-polyprenyl-1,4-benzoquinol methylase